MYKSLKIGKKYKEAINSEYYDDVFVILGEKQSLEMLLKYKQAMLSKPNIIVILVNMELLQSKMFKMGSLFQPVLITHHFYRIS